MVSEIIIKNVADIIMRHLAEESDPLVAAGNAADEIVIGIGWKPIEFAPRTGFVDLLSNHTVRFTNCFWDKQKECWVSRIRFKSAEGKMETIYNQVLNPTEFREIF